MIQSQIEEELRFKLKDLHPEQTLVQCGVDSLKLAHIANIVEENLDRELSMEEVFELDIKGVLKLIEEAEQNRLKAVEKESKNKALEKANKVEE